MELGFELRYLTPKPVLFICCLSASPFLCVFIPKPSGNHYQPELADGETEAQGEGSFPRSLWQSRESDPRYPGAQCGASLFAGGAPAMQPWGGS